jgi:L-ascorbate metabolism protein UlaG (beta-lactamase superfamily)
MQPKLVIPCHYNSPALFSKKYNPADDKMFKEEVEKMGIECVILHKGESIKI